MSLGGFDPADGVFSARMWLWSRCPDATSVIPSLDLVNAEELEFRYTDAAPMTDDDGTPIVFATTQARGLFLHDWDVRNVPFDRHTLRIDIEHALLETSDLVMQADIAESGLSPEVRLDGWRTTDFRVYSRPMTFETTYGAPSSSGTSTFSRVTIEVDIARSGWLQFLKLTVGLYIAVCVALVTFWIRTSSGATTETRMTLLVGALFAAFVNLSAASAAVGRAEQLTLIDRLHFVGMGVILAAIVLTTLNARRDSVREDIRDRWQFAVVAGIFLLSNVGMIVAARLAG